MLGCSGAAAAGLLLYRFSGAGVLASPMPPRVELKSITAAALEAARSAGATYADIRINRYRNRYVGTREGNAPMLAPALKVKDFHFTSVSTSA